MLRDPALGPHSLVIARDATETVSLVQPVLPAHGPFSGDWVPAAQSEGSLFKDFLRAAIVPRDRFSRCSIPAAASRDPP
ncbi:MAG: hypothetical protein CME06_07060 [Gemmatimonadetes bacterium]|nr:hypothetical protein [Gemmatimonadota bacterium]